MAVFMGAFPVLPGKEDDARKFAEEIRGRVDEFGASQKKFGITKEEWSLQETPMGTLVMVRFEAPDVEKAFVGLGESKDEFDIWQRKRILEVSGVDMSAPSDDPLPEIILEWTA